MTAPKDTTTALANKQHVELRSAQVGVSVLDHDSAGKFIAIKYEVPPMELDGTFNGAFEELTIAQANHRIEQLQRGVRLAQRGIKADENPDDKRYKENYVRGDGSYDDTVSIRNVVTGGRTPSHKTDH